MEGGSCKSNAVLYVYTHLLLNSTLSPVLSPLGVGIWMISFLLVSNNSMYYILLGSVDAHTKAAVHLSLFHPHSVFVSLYLSYSAAECKEISKRSTSAMREYSRPSVSANCERTALCRARTRAALRPQISIQSIVCCGHVERAACAFSVS